MEGLHALMCKAESVGLYKGASIGNISISHLLYADDVTFVGAWSQSNVCNLISILRCFFMVSGLRININKSKIVGINVFYEDVSNMAVVLGCGVEKLPMTYLAPLEESFRRPVRGGMEQHQFSELNSIYGSVSLSSCSDRWVCSLSSDGRFSVKEVRNAIDDLYLPSHSVPTRGGVESSQLALLQTYIEGTLLSNMKDRWVWDLNGKGVFRVKDVRILLDECFLPKAPTATRWVKYVPIKINVFAWKVFLDRLLTRSNLQHRGVLVSDLLCPLCSFAQEDSSHLFFSCRLVTDIVRLALNLIRTSESEYSIEKSKSDSHLNLNKWSRSLSINLSKSSKVGGNMSRIKSWDEIVDKMVDRLSKWNMKTLSIGIPEVSIKLDGVKAVSIKSNSIRDVKNKLSDIDKLLDQGGVTDIVPTFQLRYYDLRRMGDDIPFVLKDEYSYHLRIDLMTRVSDLEASVSDEEIRKAVWGCGENKSPGPDGFTFEFFRKFWTVVWRWRSWIQGSLNSGKASVLVNGSPTSEFQFHRGLKQGDPLAPFLFILIMESLHLSFNRAVEAGIFTGLRIDDALTISHLFYADDAIFIGEWSKENLKGILNILNCFSLLSGMSINLKKSHILGLGIRGSIVSEAAASLGCSVMKTPFNYLGIMVGGNMSLVKSWDETVHKLTKRLSKWKLKTLSIGGRLTLLKSVLGSTPIYNMSIFKVPKTVLNKMENLRRNFFNGIQEGDRKITWVKWHTVLAAKKFGGLGVSSFFALNRGLLAKWVWRFLSQDNSLWCQLISAIHGSNITDLSTAYPSTWNSIIKEFNYLKVQGVDVFSHCKIRIGNGLHTRFWKDLWIGDCTLSGLFPRLFALDTEKDISVAGKLQSPLVSSFRRNVRGGIEEQQLEHLVALLDSVILSNSNDRWVSDLNGDGVFRVKDVRNLLDEFFLPRADIPTRWVKNIPIKVNIFAWKLALDRLPTRANLVQRNVVTESQSCPLCDAILEDTSHLFFNCSLARDVTRLLCRWWNLGVQSFSSYAEWLVWFNSVRLASNLKVILEGVFYVTWWSLWNFRNQLLFASKKPRKESIFDDIVLRSFCWCKARVKDVRSMLDEVFLPKMEVPSRWIKSIPIKVNVFAWKLYLDRLPTRSNLSRRNVSLPSLACPLCDHVLEDSCPIYSLEFSVTKDSRSSFVDVEFDVHPL
ncbi:RNA-directed DNA polymerase, eukaryota [Tanacetum coccineum]